MNHMHLTFIQKISVKVYVQLVSRSLLKHFVPESIEDHVFKE